MLDEPEGDPTDIDGLDCFTNPLTQKILRMSTSVFCEYCIIETNRQYELIECSVGSVFHEEDIHRSGEKRSCYIGLFQIITLKLDFLSSFRYTRQTISELFKRTS